MAEPRTTDPFSGMPMWLKAVALIGLPSVLAGYMVWSTQETLAPTIISMRSDLQHHMRDIDELRKSLHGLIAITRASCVNAARTDDQRSRCLQ